MISLGTALAICGAAIAAALAGGFEAELPEIYA